MNSSSSKRRTLVDIYQFYKYKKNLPYIQGVVPKPFIKQSECTDHRLSADWNEWSTVVKCYLGKLKEYLVNGNPIELGSRAGDFHLAKAKAYKGFTDFKKSKEQGRQVKFMYNNADNYFITYNWHRPNATFKLSSYWSIVLNRAWVKSIYKACESDFTKIYKIRDAR